VVSRPGARSAFAGARVTIFGIVDHRDLATLEAGLDEIRRSPRGCGRIELIVGRPNLGERAVVGEAMIDALTGLIGDNWSTRGSRTMADRSADPDAQLTVMNARVAALVAIDPDRRPLCGDQLYVDFDLSVANVPAGSRLKLGASVLEITELPHRGCGKFVERFGVDAMRFVNSDAGRELNLRGINARVVAGGLVRVGDPVLKVS
jgi:hypothetical protein